MLPVDFVGVPIFEGVPIIAINLKLVSVVVCTPLAKWSQTLARGYQHTVKNTLEVIVGLNVGQIGPDKLKINLVLGIRQQNERRHDTLSTATLDLGRDLSVPHVVVVREQCPNAFLRHGHEQVSVLHLGETAVHPVVLCRVSKVFGVQGRIVEVVPCVGLVLADGLGETRVEGERCKRVTSS